MVVILIMLIGVLIGHKWFPQKFLRQNLNVQVICIAILIFAMGVKLGSRENFLQEISEIGFKSFVFAGISIIFSVVIVYFLSKKFIKKGSKKDS